MELRLQWNVRVSVTAIRRGLMRLQNHPARSARAIMERIATPDGEVLLVSDFVPEIELAPAAGAGSVVVTLIPSVRPGVLRRDTAETLRAVGGSGPRDGATLDVELIARANVLQVLTWHKNRPAGHLARFRLVGDASPHRLALDTGDAAPDRTDRWPRTLQLSSRPERWSAWRKLRVAIVGCGRMGTLIAMALVAQGIAYLVLIDGDLVETGNLDGTDVGIDSVGYAKANVLAEELRRRDPSVIVTPIHGPLEYEPAVEALAAADVLITAVDHDAPRIRAAALSRRLFQTHVDIGTATDRRTLQSFADIRLIVPGDRCLLCLGGVADAGADRAGEASVRRAGNSLRTINAVAANIGAQMLLTTELMAMPATSCWRRLAMTVDGTVSSTEMPSAAADFFCPWCGGSASPLQL